LAITDERNFVLQAPSGFYYATPGAVPQIAFERKGRGIPAQWLDAELNRPDRVLGEIADTTNADVRTLLQMFRAAADKKVAGSLQSGVAGSPQLTVTIAEGSRSVNPTMPIQWTASDGAGPLRSLRLFANQVPVWDTILPPGPATRSGKIMLPLVTGENQIALVATDASGRSSVPAFRRIVYAPRTPVAGRTIVIAVAVDRYADSARNLRFAVKDGKDLLAAMRAADPAHTITDSLFNEAVTAGSLRALRGKLLQTTPEDRVVLSFSGHGMLDSKLEFYYATAAMDFADPKKYGFSFAELEELFTNIPARRRLLLIDACNSGNVDRDTTSLAGADPALKVQNVPAGSRGVVLPKPSGRSSAEIFSQLFSVSSGKSGAEIIAATAGNAFAYESENWQNGVFTYAILKALSESGEYDANYDGGLSVRELKLMVYPLVQQLTGGRQKPLARFENMGYDWNLVPVKKDD
ncbi:MAG: caspase family protein, partial [Chitinophagaceae bacterium]